MATEDDTPDAAQKVSDINFNSLNSDNLGNISTLIGINTKIFETLLRIEENAFDEQDTSIKTSEVVKGDNQVIQVSKVENKPEEESFFKKLLKGLFLLLGPTVMKFWKALKGSKLIKFLWDILKVGGSVISYLAKHIWASLKNTAYVLKDISKWISDKATKLLGPLKEGFDKLKTKLSKVLGSIKSLAKNTINTIIKPFLPALNFIKEKLGTLKTFLGGLADKAKAVKNTVVKKVSAIKNKVSQGLDWFKSKKDAVVKKVSSVKDKVVSKVKAGYKVVKTKVVKVSKSVITAIKKGVGKAVAFGKSKVTQLKGKALEMAKGKIMPMIGKVLGKNAFKALGALLKFVPGVSILTGLGFGIHEAIKGNYKKAALEVVSGLIGSIPVVGPALGIATSIIGGQILDANEIKEKMTNSISSPVIPKGTNVVTSSSLANNHLNSNKYDEDNYINTEIADMEKKYNPNSVKTNKKPKAVEKQNTISKFSGMNMRQQLRQVPVPVQEQNASINTINVVKSPDDVNISEAFPHTYY